MLSDEEKRDLLERTKRGDSSAREKLIAGNLRLVLSVIKRFSGRDENADDLFQVGCIGLIKAIDNFNTELDVKFSTYAVPMIIGEIRRYLRDNNSIRVARSIRDLAYRALAVKEELQNKNNKEPAVTEIASALGSTPEAVSAALEAIIDPVSLYDPVYNDAGDSVYVMDQISDEEDDRHDAGDSEDKKRSTFKFAWRAAEGFRRSPGRSAACCRSSPFCTLRTARSCR